ncbi:hypothetical protein [Ramlibacter sp. AN1133]|uniref:hypothetical protein n=1 Tax=Ramlibacter sp. AN1133 TaxID=3133429 RepID=UPI0030BFEEE4
MVELERTGILRDGRVRELAALCRFAGNDALQVAQAIVHSQAMRYVASVAHAYARDYGA